MCPRNKHRERGATAGNPPVINRQSAEKYRRTTFSPLVSLNASLSLPHPPYIHLTSYLLASPCASFLSFSQNYIPACLPYLLTSSPCLQRIHLTVQRAMRSISMRASLAASTHPSISPYWVPHLSLPACLSAQTLLPCFSWSPGLPKVTHAGPALTPHSRA
jgi:hypothetical protein